MIDFESDKIDRYFKGLHSDKDAAYVDEVFCSNDKEKELKHLLGKQWHDLLQDNEGSDKNLDNILYRIHYEINANSLKSKKLLSLENLVKWFSRVAAILILPLAIFTGIHLYKTLDKGNIAWVEIKAPAGTRAQFSLPDGTTGWLNSNSSLKYNGNFVSKRQVILTGEAFFDVFKDKKNPFIVNTNEVAVKVLGTRFNIASYEDENNVEVVLEEGKLLFIDKGINKSYKMNPDDIVVYDKISKNFSIAKVESKKYSSWTEGKIVFRNDPLDVIARKLERWYNVEIEIMSTNDNEPRLRATFIDESLEDVLSLLNRSLAIDYRIETRSLEPDETYAKKKVIIIVKPTEP